MRCIGRKSFYGRLTFKTFSQAKRGLRVILGFSLLGVGLALTVLPGPAFVVIPLALAILAGEFVWARVVLARFQARTRDLLRRIS